MGTYIVTYPNGSHWSQCQSGIIDASFQIGVELVADKKYEAARAQLETFLKSYPLSKRSPQILFLFGQMHVAEAKRLQALEGADKQAAAREAFEQAIDQWTRLASKYPTPKSRTRHCFARPNSGDRTGSLGAGASNFQPPQSAIGARHQHGCRA